MPPPPLPAPPRAPEVALAAGLILLALAAGIAPITNNDIWLHLATGRWMWENGALPGAEVFSYTAAGRPYVAHEWGSEIIFLVLHALAGVSGLVLLKVLAAAGLALGLPRLARRWGASATAAGGFTAVALVVAAGHLLARPHLFTWLLLPATLALLHDARRHPRRLAWLVPLQVVWTNLHGAFILGPVLALGWAAGEMLRRRRGDADAHPWAVAAAGGAAAMATLVNPYGLALLRLPFELTASDVFMQAVFEWQPPWTAGYVGTAMFAGFVLMSVAVSAGWIAAWARGGARSIDPCHVLVLSGLFFLALRMNRNVPLFVLAAAPVAAVSWSVARPGIAASRRAAVAVLGATSVAALVILTAGYPYGWQRLRPRGTGPGPAVPIAACDYVEARGLAGEMFTTYGEGAYVVWRLWPRVRVGMDSRNSVYGEALYLEYREALRSDAGLQRYLSRWPVNMAIVGHFGPFRRGPQPDLDRDLDLPHRGLLGSGQFVLVDFDDITAVYASTSVVDQAGLSGDAYRVIHPVLLPAAFPAADLPAALREAESAVRRHPESVAARWILAKVYAQSERPQDALGQLQAMGRLPSGSVRRWGVAGALQAARLGLAGLMEWQSGRCDAARRSLERALEADPDYAPAVDLLARLDC